MAQLKQQEFTRPLPELMGKSIGKHIRHILEFHALLLQGLKTGVIAYEDRPHDPTLETDLAKAKDELNSISTRLGCLRIAEASIALRINYGEGEQEQITVESSFSRELAYNIEHAIHHIAMIKMASIQRFPHVALPKSFGVAKSTLRFEAAQRGKVQED